MTTEHRPDDEPDHEIATALWAAYADAAGAGADEALRAGLAARADEAGLLDLAYRSVDSAFGPLLLVASAQGLVRVAFAVEDHGAVLARLASLISPRILRTPRRTDEVARQLEAYLAGRLRRFDIALDLQLVRGFRRSVVSHLGDIPYGSTASYGQVAAAAGSPSAVRAAGSACANNPLPLIVPCHRVVRSDGSIGQYLGGAEVKAALLAMESGG